jgi:uncharacterized membrane protein
MVYVALYLVAIVAANLSTSHFGVSASYFNAFAFIGLDLVAKDKLQDAWGGRWLLPKMGALIAAGSLLSWFLVREAGPIAVASFVAFGCAAAVDALVYQWAKARGMRFVERSNVSNVPAAAVDSLVFPTIAFGGLNPVITLGQFACKVAGGLVWSLILSRFRVAADDKVSA